MLPDDSRWRDLFSGKNAAISIALSFGVVIHAVNILMATTILPSVVADIGGLNLYAWNTTLFVAASIIGSVLSARLLAVYGARIAYLISVVAFFAGSLACALAPRMEIMLLGRTIQGFGGGVMFALSYGTDFRDVGCCHIGRSGSRGYFCPVKRLAFCFWCDVAADGYLWALFAYDYAEKAER